MKKILSILFCLTLSVMITVTFSPTASFAEAYGSGQSIHYGSSSSDEENTDDGYADPIIVSISFMGYECQGEAYKMLGLVNSDRNSKSQFGWSQSVYDDAFMTAKQNATYYSDDGYYGSNDKQNISMGADFVYVSNAASASAFYAEIKDSIKSNIIEYNSYDEDDEYDSDTPVYLSMGASEIITAEGNHYWVLKISTDTPDSDNETFTDSGLKKLSIGFSDPEFDINTEISGIEGTYGKSWLTAGCKYSYTSTIYNITDNNTLHLVDYNLKSSNTSVISVNASSGTINAKKAGMAYVRWYADEQKDGQILYTVLPKQIEISKIKKYKGKLAISWDESPGATGYYVYYSTSKDGNFTYAGHTSKTSKTISKLKRKQTYYVMVKPYVYTSAKYFGNASEVVEAKTK